MSVSIFTSSIFHNKRRLAMELKKLKILIIEDNIIWQRSYKKWLGNNHIYDFAEDSEMAIKVFNRFLPDVVLLDLGLPRIEQGLDTLDKLIACRSDAKIIVITASQDHQTALEAQKRGAYSYFSKSEDIKDELPLLIKRAAHMQILERENQNLRKELNNNLKFSGIISVSKDMQKILQLIETIKNTTETVLIDGESGVGKEVIAKHIHNRSNRSSNPFIAINLATIPENLLENELFGHEKGAFTGADQQKKGLFEMADSGTLFLDEIGELHIMMQAKLLRVLQERKFYRLGGVREHKTNFRLIAATNRDLSKEVDNHNFREDLYYRINVIPIHISALRERPDDIPALIDFFVERYCHDNKLSIPAIDSSFIAYLSKMEWKGNIRQLENMIIRMLVFNPSNLSIKNLPEELQKQENPIIKNALNSKFTLDEMTRLYIKLVYEHTGRNKKAACEYLNINYRTLTSRLK
jgi:DNA-binding NtrC family response regulator